MTGQHHRRNSRPPRRTGRSLALLALLMAAGTAPAQESTRWNQWRGPSRDGRILNFRPPSRWPEMLTKAWSAEVGIGYASPVVVGDGVYIFSRQGEEEVVRRLQLETGKEVWKEHYPAPYVLNPAAAPHGLGPKSTPLCDGSRVYTLGISGILSGLDAATGKSLWRHDFKGEFPQSAPLYGAATSPLLDGGLLIVHVGGHDRGALTAFDPRTGDVRWRWTGDGPAYSSPIAVTLDGVRQIVT